jgi:hypothetical protein
MTSLLGWMPEFSLPRVYTVGWLDASFFEKTRIREEIKRQTAKIKAIT